MATVIIGDPSSKMESRLRFLVRLALLMLITMNALCLMLLPKRDTESVPDTPLPCVDLLMDMIP